jgi:hypothetical protein
MTDCKSPTLMGFSQGSTVCTGAPQRQSKAALCAARVSKEQRCMPVTAVNVSMLVPRGYLVEEY